MTITMTSKNQVTIPVALCKELHMGPGDKLEAERITLPDGREILGLSVLPSNPKPSKWIGYFKGKIKGGAHDIVAERKVAQQAMGEAAVARDARVVRELRRK